MVRLVYVFVSDGAANGPGIVPFDKVTETQNIYATEFQNEGFFSLWKNLAGSGNVSQISVVIESTRAPGYIKFNDNFDCYVVPHIDDFEPYRTENDIYFIRGGFRSWFPFLTKLQQQNRWIFFYQAATNRGNWPFWDMVFNDVMPHQTHIDRWGRLQYFFSKPTNQDVFKAELTNIVFDVCIGASHIHDKKSQWKTVKAAIAYKDIYKENLKCVLPGRSTKGVFTNEIGNDIKKHSLDVYMPGMVPRKELNGIYNRCKVFSHLGGAGQNDRGVLEALSCGLPLILCYRKFHAPFTYANPEFCTLVNDDTNFEMIARHIHKHVVSHTHGRKLMTRQHFERHSDIRMISRRITKLMQFFEEEPVVDPDRKTKIKKMHNYIMCSDALFEFPRIAQ